MAIGIQLLINISSPLGLNGVNAPRSVYCSLLANDKITIGERQGEDDDILNETEYINIDRDVSNGNGKQTNCIIEHVAIGK